MTKKTSDAVKRHLKEQYEKACNAYLCELLNRWELDAYYGYWNIDKPGTIYHYGETHNLSMEDIIYCVENDIPENEVLEWEDYLLDAHEFGFTLPNLDAWHNGCPRTPESVFDKLRGLKQDLADAIEEGKARQRGDSKDTAPFRPLIGDSIADNADDNAPTAYIDGTGYHTY